LIIKVARHNSNFTSATRVVEHTFPLASPLLEKIEVVRHGKVRRSKLYYIRRLSTKEARLKERRENIAQVAVPDMLVAAEAAAEAPVTEPEKTE
jgi:hypothetical protein